MYLRRKPCCLFIVLIVLLVRMAGAQALAGASQRRAAVQRFLAHRGVSTVPRPGAFEPPGGAPPGAFALALANARGRRYASDLQLRTRLPAKAGHKAAASPILSARTSREAIPADIATRWHAVGPMQTLTSPYGAITGRISSIALDPADLSGNTAYLGTTGGGVWKSTNAAGGAAIFTQISDNALPSTLGIGSQSIGAVSVQPGGTGVILAGTGDPNDALDSYYGSGILRSTNHGATWTTVSQSSDPPPSSPVSFYGEGFSGFAWSSTNPDLVVAAVTQAYDATVVNAEQMNSADGLYYSPDAGVTWLMATMMDGLGQVLQSPLSTRNGPRGNAVTAVVWNPVRHLFYAAVRFHGYYTSPDGMTWTRLVTQPGANLTSQLCPTRSPGAISCPIFRGALAVQPVTGDTFAVTVDVNLADQGIWQDACTANAGHCTTGATPAFAARIPDSALEQGGGTIAQGDYNLWLAAVPSNADTLLFVGTEDIWKRSLAATNVPWRNTTNATTSFDAQVAPSQHAVAAGPGGLLYFGNDGGLWKTNDAVNQQPVNSASDAAHFQNLNSSLGSLAELSSVASSPGSDSVLLAGEGVDGSAGTSASGGTWQQALDGTGAFTAIDPAIPLNWFVTSGPGVSISYCGIGDACLPSSFTAQPLIGNAQTGGDGQDLGEPAVWMLDPQDSSSMIVGTCRIWRGGITGGVADWTSANAISPMLDLNNQSQCAGNAQVKSLGASGTTSATQEILYAGMEGVLTGGGLVAGHVFTANVSAAQSGAAVWTDLFSSQVVNDMTANRGQFNPGGFGVSSVVADTHDSSGRTVYATIQGFSGNGISEPLVYRSVNQGQSWTNITANLPNAPVNALVVDPGNAGVVYLATDAGVYMTNNIANCNSANEQCWSLYGIGLPDAPVTTLGTNGTGGTLLVAGTYGRGAWEMLLASAPVPTVPNTPATDTLSTASLTFGVQAVGTASAPQYVTITNSGGAALTSITAMTLSTNFLVDDTACLTNVPAGAQPCAISVIFAPLAPGPSSGSLTIADSLHIGANALVVSLLGAGAAPAGIVSLSPGALDFGSQGQGSTSAAQSFTLTNNGTVALTGLTYAAGGDFGLASGTCGTTLAVRGSCEVPVTFTPSTTGVRLGSLSVYADELAAGLTSSLSGTGLNFTIAVTGSPTATVVTGTTASFGLTIAGVGNSAGSIMMSCTSVPALPAGSACTMNPASLPIVNGVTGTASVSVTTPALAVSRLRSVDGSGSSRWLVLALMAPLLGCCRRKSFPWAALPIVFAAVVLGGGLSGCSASASGGSTSGGGGTGGTGGGGGGSVASSTYTLKVTAVAPGISRTASMTLIVEQ